MNKQRTPREGFVYLAQSGPYKIGASNQPDIRADQIRKGSAIRPPDVTDNIDIIWKCWVADCVGVERILHARYELARDVGEWFWLTDADIAWITNQTAESLGSVSQTPPPDNTHRSRSRREAHTKQRKQVGTISRPPSIWGRVDCLLDALCRLTRLHEPRGVNPDISIALRRSGIPQATFWRLIKNWNERIGLDALARCCALLQIAITDLLYYRPSNDCPFDLPIPHLIPEPLTIYGRIEVVLGRVLAEYENVFGEALGDLTDLIQLPLQRHRIEALVAGRPIQEQIDLPILERTIYVLT